jgi:hypothetical protein
MGIYTFAEPAVVEPPLPRSIADLTKTLQESLNFDARRARALLTQLDMSTVDLRPWHDFDHDVRDSYGRLLLARGDNFELMVMSWAPGDYSAIHDHGVAEWGAVRYFGAADHIVFAERDGLLSINRRMTMRTNDVFAVDHSLIHLMGNPTDFPFISLHLYGRSHAANSITGSARIFDLYENQIQRTDGGVFFCLPEQDIQRREPCPLADIPTRLLHHRLMLARIERILASGNPNPVLEDKAQHLGDEIRRLLDLESSRTNS